mgnify:CR=1 FL=1
MARSDEAFERHPRLRVGSIEHELSWARFFLFQADYCYTDRPLRGDWHRFAPGVLPSDFFKRNCFMSFQEDAVGIRVRDVLGAETLMWGSDYPPVSTREGYDNSLRLPLEYFSDLSEDDRASIFGATAQAVWGLPAVN